MRYRTTAISSLFALSLAGCAAHRPAPLALPQTTPAPSSLQPAEVRGAVVSVRITGQDWDWRAPWSKQQPWTRVVSGLVVSGRRILVASPFLGNQVFIEIQKMGREERTPARLVLFDPQIPLGLLVVEEERFWTDLAPLPIGWAQPDGGEARLHRWLGSGQLDSAAVRIRQSRLSTHGASRVPLLSLDLSGSTEGGGDSEVLTVDREVRGLVASRSGDTLVAIASPVLLQFLELANEQPYPGLPRTGLAWQQLTNPSLRGWLGLREGEGGIRMTHVLSQGSGGGVLRPGDVLLEVDGLSIDATGQIDHPDYGRILFVAAITRRRPGVRLPLRVLRDGERQELTLELRHMPPEDDLVPAYLYGRGPDYVIRGGLVFQELLSPYLGSRGNGQSVPPRILIAHDRDGSEAAPRRERIILLSSVLPDPANLGYQDLRDQIVTRINDQPIDSLAAVRRAFAKPQGGFHVVELLPGSGPERIVLSDQDVAASVDRIRERYDVDPTMSSGPAVQESP